MTNKCRNEKNCYYADFLKKVLFLVLQIMLRFHYYLKCYSGVANSPEHRTPPRRLFRLLFDLVIKAPLEVAYMPGWELHKAHCSAFLHRWLLVAVQSVGRQITGMRSLDLVSPAEIYAEIIVNFEHFSRQMPMALACLLACPWLA